MIDMYSKQIPHYTLVEQICNADLSEDWLDDIQSAGTNAKIAYTTDQTARSTRNATRATALTDKKSALAAKREAQESAADKQYKETEQSAWNTGNRSRRFYPSYYRTRRMLSSPRW